MISGIWLIVILPVVVAFLFSLWVAIIMIIDVSGRHHLSGTNVVGNQARIKIPPSNTQGND
jgi:hypothetical protein